MNDLNHSSCCCWTIELIVGVQSPSVVAILSFQQSNMKNLLLIHRTLLYIFQTRDLIAHIIGIVVVD